MIFNDFRGRCHREGNRCRMKNRQNKILQRLVIFQRHNLKADGLALSHIKMSAMTHVATVIHKLHNRLDNTPQALDKFPISWYFPK